jgi:PAS domain S-box-containing protein
MAGVLLTDGGGDGSREFWSEPGGPSEELKESLRALARDAMRTASKVSLPPAAAAGAPMAGASAPPVAWPFSANQRVLGAIAIAPTASESAVPGISIPLSALTAIVGHRVALREAEVQHRLRTERDERWFKTLDGHLRVLDRERQKFAAFVDQTDIFVFVTDGNRTIRWLNRSMIDLFPPEHETESWVGRPCSDVCDQLGSRCASCPIERVVSERASVHEEMHATVRGSAGLLYWTVLPLIGPSGVIDEVMVVIQDLTSLEGLRRSESRYRLLYERNVDPVVMVDPKTFAIVLANEAACSMLEASSAELSRMNLADLHAPLEWERLRGRYAACLAGETTAPGEGAFKARRGQHRIASIRGSRLVIDGADLLMLHLHDITEQRRAERALERAELQLRAVVANAPVVLFAIDQEGVFTLSEGHGLRSLGLEPGQVVGQSVFELYRGTPEVLEHVRRALSGGEFTAEVDIGSLVFETRYGPMRNAAGEIQGVIGVATDVTDRRRAERALEESEQALRRSEEQLRQAQKMEAVGVLAGGVAHDFNNILTIVLTQSEILLERLPRESPWRQKVAEIRAASERGALLTRQLLTFSRNEVLAPRLLDLNAIVAGLEGLLRRLIGEDVEFAFAPAPEIASIVADRGQVEQVIMNLAVNGRDAMPMGGRLDVSVSVVDIDASETARLGLPAAGRYSTLRVRDTGQGMDLETQRRIFEPFFTTKERGKGTGLGLATVYGIVRQGGGSISVVSAPSQGAEFTVHFPFRSDVPAPAAAPRGTDSRGGSETVLLVEDEPGVRTIGRELLELSGYVVIEAENGVDALEKADAYPGPIHLLLSDVVMPRMGGRELAQRLATRRPGLRVLLVSGFTDDTILRHGVHDSGMAFLQKPFTLESLSQRVREVLDSPPVIPP